MFKITPEYLTNYLNFYYGKVDWYYNKNEANNIAKIQTEGTAKLWNLLLEKNIALLADEVGMGKTYQALGIMLTLWLQKPDAKVLLYAPNEIVALKWVNEYNNFIRYHYRIADNRVKSTINGTTLRQAIYCESHLELMKAIKTGWPSLYICKTSSLSNLLSKKITQDEIDKLQINITKDVDDNSADEDKARWMYRFASKCNEQVFTWLSPKGKSPFDLLIFDEAHYLRRAEGDSNRSIVAHAFFTRRDIRQFDEFPSHLAPIAKNVLLLTATPNHSAAKDIVSIVSLFNEEYIGKNAFDILNAICVRRFRRLEGKTKHEYRKEIDEPVAINNIREKIFFATYQRALVRHKAAINRKNKSNDYKQNPYSILFGYLEGFEFLPNSASQDKKIKDSSISGDYVDREDGQVIQELSDKYKRSYGHYPLHPKYVKTVEQLQPSGPLNMQPDKKVVFVRRIPSVFEISRRVIEKYDELYFEILQNSKAFDDVKKLKKFSEKKLRKYFYELAKTEQVDSEDENITLIEEEGPSDAKSKRTEFYNVDSKIFSLFTIKKDHNYKTTDCSNFRNRFLKKEQIFSVFFEPAMDYKKMPYSVDTIYYNGEKRLYRDTLKYQRFNLLDETEKFQMIGKINLEPNSNTKKLEPIQFDTIFTLLFNLQCSDATLAKKIQQAELTYNNFSIIEKEGFTKYLEKGILFSSSFLVVFYAEMKSIASKKNYRGEDLYLEFSKTVKANMEGNGLVELICKAIQSFRIFYRKELGKTEANLLAENWSFLTNTLPVFPVCADTNRNSILKAFNTPFFPNTLISTSVLQEGVDLHYHCNEVIHYGLAWTQGDNEQRVGRVDRLNGKMELQLKTNTKAELPIHYPYLQNTIDEDQTSRFILRKFEAEKLIDQFKNVELTKEINYAERVPEEVWKKCFNNPEVIKENIKDPYPVLIDLDFEDIQVKSFKNTNNLQIIDLLDPIFNSLAHRFSDQFKLYKKDTATNDNRLFAIRHIRENGRHQPLIAEFDYYEQGMSILKIPVFYLRIKTPIYKRGHHYDNLTHFGNLKDTYAHNPIIKICYDDKRKDEFRYFVCIDLPLFQISKSEINISHKELIFLIEELIGFSDDLEKQFTGNADIKNEKIIKSDLSDWQAGSNKLVNDRATERDEEWKVNRHYLYKEKPFIDMLMNQLYAQNKDNLFIKYYRKFQKNFTTVGIYKKDALDQEKIFLNTIFQNTN
ncbi:MAG: DEAD/DEAH box helicase [Bacteroidales bacterium]|nr:DEAD/DEAH box helicase [Bacteroidales bacterium]